MPAKRRRFWITGRFAGVDGSSFAVNVEAADEQEAKAEALRVLSGATPIPERAGARVDHTNDEADLPDVETIVDGKLQPERTE